MKTFDISEEDCKEITELLKSDDFKQWFKDNVGLHGNQSGYGVKITASSFFAAYLAYRKMEK